MSGFKRLLWLLPTLAAVILAACGQTSETDGNQSDKLQVVTSFYPIQALTTAVTGDSAEVTVMMENADAHDYEPSAQDIASLNEADVFIYNAEDMETWVPTLLDSIDNEDLTIIEAAADVERIGGDVATIGGEEEHDHEEEGHEEGHSHDVDPHTWLDPLNAITEAKTIARALADIDQENATTYQENAATFETDMTAVHNKYENLFKEASNKTLLTQHAAFGYLAHRYGLEQVAVTGVTDSAEPSIQRVAQVVDYMKDNNLSVIYTQAGGSTDIADTIASEANASVRELQSMESVDTNTYPANGQGFIAIMEENLDSLAQVLQ